MKRRVVTLLQHAPDEGGGIIEDEIRKRELPFQRIELFSTNELPPIRGTHLVVMGGVMSVNDETEFPWLAQEKILIRECIPRGGPVLGICLGAQHDSCGREERRSIPASRNWDGHPYQESP